MQSSHAAAAVSSAFHDPNLIAYGGLKPVVRLAERCGLPALVGEHVRLPASKDGTGGLGRGAPVLDLRRRDSRDPLHRFHFQAEKTAGHRPTDRAPRQAPERRYRARPAWPAPPAASPCTCPNAGPGARTSPSCSARCMHRQPSYAPCRPARKGPRPVDKVEELGRPAATPCPNPQLSPNTACTTPKRSTGNQADGSEFSCCP